MNDHFMCPVCGYPDLDEPPRTTSGPSYEICNSCGFEYGFTDDNSKYSYKEWRERWIAQGMQWRAEGIVSRPIGWDPKAQLSSLLNKIRAGWPELLTFSQSSEEFTQLVSRVQKFVRPEARFPEWPFASSAGLIRVFYFKVALSQAFGSILDALVSQYQDVKITMTVLEPELPFFGGFYPAFQAPSAGAGDAYWAGISYEPRGEATKAIATDADVFAVAGNSGKWAVWAQRDWEVALLLTADEEGPWLNTPVPQYRHDVDLDDFRSPSSWSMPLSENDVQTFWRNIREHGSGPGDPAQ